MARIDERSFDPVRISPEVSEFNQMMLAGMQSVGWVFPPKSATALRTSLAQAGEPPKSERARVIRIPAPHGEIAIRVIAPDGPSTGLFIHCHGGGWTIGATDANDAALERVCDRTGMTVASIEYRLAPEYPYPAPVDDCETATRWLIEHVSDFGADKVLIGGESAGANLALSAALRIIKDTPQAFRALALYYGNYDLTMTPSVRQAESGVLITRASLDWFFDQYVPDVTLRGDPDVSPLYADLSGLPPTILAVGSADSLLDDTLFLAARLLASGVECELEIVPGAEHAFDNAPAKPCQDAVAVVDAFLSGHARRP